MILCVGTTPAAQRVMVFRKLVPDAVNRALTTLDGAAGKAVNVAKVLKSLGEVPLVVGFAGGTRGEQLRQRLAAAGVEFEFTPARTQTRQCITVMDEAARTITELVEEGGRVEPLEFEQLWETTARWIPQSRAVVMSGTIAPGVPMDFYRRCIELARPAGVLTVVDAHGPVLAQALEARPDLVKPNREELAAMVGKGFVDETMVLAAMRALIDQGACQVVVTAGTGPTLACNARSAWRIYPAPIQTLNPIGSGDAFTAALAAHLLRGEDLGEACRWGAAAGAANALTPMPGELEPGDVERLAREVRIEPINLGLAGG